MVSSIQFFCYVISKDLIAFTSSFSSWGDVESYLQDPAFKDFMVAQVTEIFNFCDGATDSKKTRLWIAKNGSELKRIEEQ